MKGRPVRVVQWGCGRWGRNLVRTLQAHPEVELACVIDPDPLAREQAKSLAPAASVVPPEQAPSLESFDAGVVAVPGPLHARVARPVLEAGRHLFVEKPFATTQEDAEALARMAARTGSVVMVGHLACFHPAVAQAVQLVRRGAIGRLVAFRSQRRASVSRDVDGSVLWSLAPHDVAVLRCLDPSGLEEIRAWRWVELGADGVEPVRQRAKIEGRTRRGVHVSMAVSRGVSAKERRLEMQGTEGTIVVDELEQPERVLGIVRAGRWEAVSFPAGEQPLSLELAAWVDAVTGRAALSNNDVREAVEVVRVLQRAHAEVAEVVETGTREIGLSTW